jgi:DNA ligase (NAD+)
MDAPIDVRREVAELRKNLHDWSFQYYVWSAGPDDSVYDAAYARLQEIEKKYPGLEDPNSPTQRVGAPVPFGDKVKHKVPMLSLEKAKSPTEVAKFFDRDCEGVIEPKIDGLSLSLRYINGRLVQALTRGNGEEGQDVTPNARTIRSLPVMLRNKNLTLEVRGEVFMRWSHFEQLNKRLIEEQDQPLANPRNAASGALSLKSPLEVRKVPLSFIAYRIVGRVEGEKLERHTQVLELLEELGFMTCSNLPSPAGECPSMYQAGLRLNDLSEITAWVTTLDKARRLQDFPTDGLVFKVDDLSVQHELGVGTTAPKWAVAFKYPPDQVKTRIKGIEWTVGKTGKITPVAEFEPVVVSGSTVARASLCNAAEIKRLGVNVGDEVMIEKSNEIIPKVITVVAKHSKHPAQPPKTCPVCSSAIHSFEGYVDVFCTNPGCQAQAAARLTYAVSKNALDIDGCGPQAITTFVAHGVVTLPALLTSDCACFKGATKTKLQAGLKKAMTVPLWRKLSALCIDGWGRTTCQEVATRWPALPLLLDAQDNKELDFIVGEAKAKELSSYMKSHEAELGELLDLGYFPVEAVVATTGALNGKSFCITGSLVTGEGEEVGRAEAQEQIENRGGIAKNSCTSKTDFLVVGETPGNNKLAAARRWGTKTISADQLFDMLDWRPTKPAASTKNEER